MSFCLNFSNLLLLLLLYLFQSCLKSIGCTFCLIFRGRVNLLRVFELPLELFFQLSYLIFLCFLQSLHFLTMDQFHLNKLLFKLEILFDFEADLFLITGFKLFCLVCVSTIQMTQLHTILASELRNLAAEAFDSISHIVNDAIFLQLNLQHALAMLSLSFKSKLFQFF